MRLLSLNNVQFGCSRKDTYYFLALFVVSSSCVRASVLSDPYASANRNPFVQVYGLPASQAAQLIEPAKLQWGLQLEAASNFTINHSGNESIFIDGESHRMNMQFRYGLTEGIEFGINLPYLNHQGGRLDSFIDKWHDFFALPDGGRTKVAKNRLHYSYQQGDNTLFDINRSSDGLGDISINVGYQLSRSVTRQWALRGGIKLPTGKASHLHGSESTDIFLGVNVSDQGLLQEQKITLHTSVGALWMSTGDVINNARKDWVMYGSSTVSWFYNERVSLKVQVDFHSAFYDSALTELGDSSVQLILGGAVQLTEKWLLDLSVSEDIAVDTAPDVVFQFGFKRRFDI